MDEWESSRAEGPAFPPWGLWPVAWLASGLWPPGSGLACLGLWPVAFSLWLAASGLYGLWPLWPLASMASGLRRRLQLQRYFIILPYFFTVILTSTSPSKIADYIVALVYYYAALLLYLPLPHRLKLLIISLH